MFSISTSARPRFHFLPVTFQEHAFGGISTWLFSILNFYLKCFKWLDVECPGPPYSSTSFDGAHSFLAEDGSVPFLNLRVTGVRVEAQQVDKVLPPPVAFLYARYCTIINALALSGLLVESKWGFLNMCSIYISYLTRNIHSLWAMDSVGLFVPRGGSFCKEMNALTLSA